jgi:hypothetical protein
MRAGRVVLCLWTLCVSACVLPGGVGPVGPHAAHGSCRADVVSGGDETAREFATFLEATDTFITTAGEVDRRLLQTCREFGSDLGMGDGELDAAGAGTMAVCGQVTARVRSEMAAIRRAKVRAQLVVTEPVCETRVDEFRRCIEKCEPRVVKEGRIEYRCEGGELRGRCDGECNGRCAAQAQGQCGGACEGTCTGECSGVCDGICEGECAARGPDGRCAGACRGTCRGTCTAGCSGQCNGRCIVEVRAACGAECRGGCSIEYTEPVCTGRIVPPEVRTECRELCDSIRVSRQVCTPGSARLVVDASEVQKAAHDTNRIVHGIAARMPEIRAIGSRLYTLRDAGAIMLRTSAGFASGAASLGAAAVACAAQEAVELPRAVNQVSVAFQVTVSFSASVDVSASSE